MTTEHHLKCWAAYFDALEDGRKNFDVRRNDRGYQTGDIVRLFRYDPKARCFIACRDGTSKPLRYRIEYLYSGHGVEPGFVVLGLVREDATP